MQADLQPDEAVRIAADYIVSLREGTGQAIVPDIKNNFGLTTPQAIEAIRLAQRLRDARVG